MAGTPVRNCYIPATSPSRWVYGIYETCNGEIGVYFQHGEHIVTRLARGPGRYIGIGGAPSVFCVYPGTGQGLNGLGHKLYELAIVWPYAGEFVHHFLYRVWPYVIKAPPQMPCGCHTQVSITSSENPSNFGDLVTFSATVTDTDGSLPPDGIVQFYDGATLLGAGSTLSDSGNTATSAFSISTLSVGTHTITAVFASTTGFITSQASLTQVVNGSIASSCCPSNPFPLTMHVTLTDAGGCSCLAGSYVVIWNGTNWSYSGVACTGKTLTITVSPPCALSVTCGGESPTFLPQRALHDCSPLHISYEQEPGHNFSVCCGGSVGAVLTT